MISDTKLPSEALQVSVQMFAIEMAKHLVIQNGCTKDDALKLGVKNTRKCLDNLGLTIPKDKPHD